MNLNNRFTNLWLPPWDPHGTMGPVPSFTTTASSSQGHRSGVDRSIASQLQHLIRGGICRGLRHVRGALAGLGSLPLSWSCNAASHGSWNGQIYGSFVWFVGDVLWVMCWWFVGDLWLICWWMLLCFAPLIRPLPTTSRGNTGDMMWICIKNVFILWKDRWTNT